MTTRDAGNSAWQAVQLGKPSGLLLVFFLTTLLATGCVTTGTTGQPEQVATPTSAGIVNASPPEQGAAKSESPSSYVVKGKRYHVNQPAPGHVENGTASWYGKRFHGRRTSSGERFDMHAMTAAHKKLPLASLIQVTNLENGRSTVVRVNDRGPFHGNRVLDLSFAAASQLDMVDKGMAKVEIQVLDTATTGLNAGLQRMFVAAADKANADLQGKTRPADTQASPFIANADAPVSGAATGNNQPKVAASAAIYLQVGHFDNRTHAERLRQELVDELEESVMVRTDTANDRTPYMVQVGPLDSKVEAGLLSRRLASLGITDPTVVMR